jgi:opacity protein-like surface antigen
MNKYKFLVVAATGWLALSAVGQESSMTKRWRARFDIGAVLPENPTLSEIGGPVTGGGDMDLSTGLAFDLAAGYRITPWLLLEGDLGFTYNEIDSVGNWSPPASASLSQVALMINAEFSYPLGRFVPFAGIGGGGVYSTVSFAKDSSLWFYSSDSAGSGDDFVAAAQVFAGVRYEFNPEWSAGVSYRILATGSQTWEVDWYTGNDFDLGVYEVLIHFICFTVTGRF